MKIYSIAGLNAFDLAKILIKNAEGFREYPYLDKFGHATIGYGFLVSEFDTETKKAFYRDGITVVQANQILDNYIKKISSEIIMNFGPKLDANVFVVLVDLVYDLGWSEFLTFVTFIPFIENNKIDEAVNDLANTLWYEQVDKRGVRDCFCLLSKKNYYLI